MGRERHDQISESFVGLTEASQILNLTEDGVQDLIRDHQLTAYQLGDQIVRLKKDEVWEYESRARISAGLFPDERDRHQSVPLSVHGTAGDRVRDFFYFNDFYLISFIVFSTLIYLILSSH